MAGVRKSAYTYVCITYFRLESEFQRNTCVSTYVLCHSRLEYIICIPARNFLPLARTYVCIPLWYVRTYMELRSLQVRKLIPAILRMYIRIYIFQLGKRHCGELSGIRICIFCCKVRVDWKWKIVEWKVVAFLFVYTVLTVRAMSTILKLT